MPQYSPFNNMNTHDSNGRPLRTAQPSTGSETRPATVPTAAPQSQQQGNMGSARHTGSNRETAAAAYGGPQFNLGRYFQTTPAENRDNVLSHLNDIASADVKNSSNVEHNGNNEGRARAGYGHLQLNMD